MKIVLDTKILVRANEHSHGLARELLANIVGRKHRLLLQTRCFYELARVLRYPGLHAFYDLPENLVFGYIGLLRQSSEIVTPAAHRRRPQQDFSGVGSGRPGICEFVGLFRGLPNDARVF